MITKAEARASVLHLFGCNIPRDDSCELCYQALLDMLRFIGATENLKVAS